MWPKIPDTYRNIKVFVKNVFFVGINDSIFCPPCSFVISVVLRSCLGFLVFIALCCWEYVRVFYHFFALHFYRYRVGFTVLSFYHFIVLSSCLDWCTNFLSLFCFIESFLRGVVANCPLIDFTPQK